MKALIAQLALLLLTLTLSACIEQSPLQISAELSILTSNSVNDNHLVRFSSSLNTEQTSQLTWDFGDGFRGQGSPIQHQYQNPGTYTVKLFYHHEGGTSSTEKTININGNTTQIVITSNLHTIIDSDTNDPNVPLKSNNVEPQTITPPAQVSGILIAPNGCQAGRLCKQGDKQDIYSLQLAYGQALELTVLEGALGITLNNPQGEPLFNEAYLETPLLLDPNQLGQGDFLLTLSLPDSINQAQYTFSIKDDLELGLHQPGKLIVMWHDQTKPELVDIQDPRLRPVHNQGLQAARGFLSRQKNVKSVSLNYLRFPSNDKTNQFWQWPLQLQQIETLWQPLSLRGQSPGEKTRIAILDTGLYMNHEKFAQLNLADGFDFVSDPINSQDGDGWDNNPDDPGDAQQSYHGSHVTGIIAAQPIATQQEKQQVLGIAWGATIMPIRVLGQHGGTSYDLIQAMRYAAGLENDSQQLPSKAADIINLSLGGASFSAAEQATINEVINSGCIIIAAAGNHAIAQVEYPARYQNVIAVGAYAQDKTISHYSNYGLHLDLLAPGGECSDAQCSGGITSISAIGTLTKDFDSRSASLKTLSGTSMASAHVSALVGIMRSYLPSLDTKQLIGLIQDGKLTRDWHDDGFDRLSGWGNIDSAKMLNIMDTSPLNKSGIWTTQPVLYLAENSVTTLPIIHRGHDQIVLEATYDSSQLEVLVQDTDIQVHTLPNFKHTQYINLSNPSIESLTLTIHPKQARQTATNMQTILYVNKDATTSMARAINTFDGWQAQIDSSLESQVLHVSSDIDYDGIYCEPGEFCALAPSGPLNSSMKLEGSILQH